MEKQRRQLTPEQDALEHIVACRDKPFLEERFIDSFKGRGVFTHKAIEPSMFVVEYRGNIFTHKDTTPKKKCGDTLNNFLCQFSWKGAQWCVDASKEDRTLGRLVNDDHISPNCEMKKISCEGKPHLCLFAVTEISPGEEITYNYGDSSYLWRSKATTASCCLCLCSYNRYTQNCGIDAWKRWIQWRKSQTNLELVSSHAVTLNEDVLRCSATELSDFLCSFITEAKRPDGEPYFPDSLFYLCLSIQQCLFENGRMENIFSDLIYNKFSTKFTKILKGFKPSITASGCIHSRVEEEFLWDCKQLGAYSPIVLLNTLLFFCCKYLGFTTVEQHRQLSFAHVMRCTKTNQNNTKTTFLRFYPPISINEAESDADGVPAKKRKKNESKEDIVELMENTENPLRCPVRLYEFYLSKCSELVRRRTDLFYLQPDRRCVPNSPLWFSSNPLDDSTVEAMLVRTLAVQELQGEDGRAVDQQRSDDTLFTPDEEDSE